MGRGLFILSLARKSKEPPRGNRPVYERKKRRGTKMHVESTYLKNSMAKKGKKKRRITLPKN